MLTVRPADPADADQVAGIHIRAWQVAYAGIIPDDVLAALDGQRERRAARIRARWSAAEPGPFRTVVAADGTAPVAGFATYGPYRLDPTGGGQEVDPDRGEVLLIYVDPDRQRAGVGRVLMDATVEALRDRSMTEVRLWVLERNAPARRFYQRYGFVADGGRHLFRVDRPGGSAVVLPEIRYALRLC